MTCPNFVPLQLYEFSPLTHNINDYNLCFQICNVSSKYKWSELINDNILGLQFILLILTKNIGAVFVCLSYYSIH